MHESLPRYLVLEVGAKLAKCFRGHLRAPHAISCISCVLLYDWPSHLREQINRTFQFRNCHGKFFCSFWCIHGNNPRAVSVWEKRLHTKKSFPVGKRHLPMGKRASITMTNVTKHCCSFDWKLRNTQIIAELCKNLKMGTHILLRGCFMS